MDKRLEVRIDSETLAAMHRHVAGLPSHASLSEWARAELVAAMHRDQHSARCARERAQLDRDLAAWRSPDAWPARCPDTASTKRTGQPAAASASTKREDNAR
jgi:hypothetical protein